MDFERMARKLRPLMPEKAERWLRVLSTGGPQLKTLVQRQILRITREIFGGVNNNLLLSLPSRRNVRGEFQLGEVVYEKEKWPAGLTRNELMRNVAIFGMSGAGKTNVVLHLVRQLVEKKVPFLFLDWKRNARQFLPGLRSKVNVYTPGREVSEFTFNPLIAPPGLERNVYVNHFVDMLSSA